MSAKFIEMIRQMFEEGEKKRIDQFDETVKNTDGLYVVSDLLYGSDPKWNTFEIIYPEPEEEVKKKRKIYPVILQVHGGGWIYGSVEGYRYYSAMMARHGFAVITFNYRLGPEYHFPAPIEDTEQMMHWIDRYAKDYHLDITRMFGIADSAGAHTLGAFVTAMKNNVYAKTILGGKIADRTFRALILNSGVFLANREADPTDFGQILARAYLELPKRKRSDVLEEEEKLRENKVIDQFEFMAYMTSDFPPTFLMTSAEDFVKEQSIEMIRILCEKSVASELHIYQSDQRKLEHTFQEDLMLPEAVMCNEEEMEYLTRMMEWKK